MEDLPTKLASVVRNVRKQFKDVHDLVLSIENEMAKKLPKAEDEETVLKYWAWILWFESQYTGERTRKLTVVEMWQHALFHKLLPMHLDEIIAPAHDAGFVSKIGGLSVVVMNGKVNDFNNSIEFTEELFEAFKERHAEAVANDEETFFFEGQEILTTYAHFMIMFLETKFPDVGVGG